MSDKEIKNKKKISPERLAKIQAVMAQVRRSIVQAIAEQHRLGTNGL